MLNIYKEATDYSYNFKINTNDGYFQIVFLDNLDLYWYYECSRTVSYKTFYIMNENYYLFSLFNELYNSNYHQIHIEEYLYQKRLVKRKETI